MDSGDKEIKYQEGISCMMKRCPQKNRRKRNYKKGLEPFLDSFLSQVANQHQQENVE